MAARTVVVFPHLTRQRRWGVREKKAWKENWHGGLQMKKDIKLCDTVDSRCCRSEGFFFSLSLSHLFTTTSSNKGQTDLGFLHVLSAFFFFFYLLRNLSVTDGSGCKAPSLSVSIKSVTREHFYWDCCILPEIEVGSCCGRDFMW